MSNRIIVYAGTYTLPVAHVKQSAGEGIHIFSFDTDSGQLTKLDVTGNIESPSFLAIDSTQSYLYAGSEVDEWAEDRIRAFAINPDDGKLTFLNHQSAMGSSAAYVSVDRSNQYVLAANYSSGSVVLFPIEENGSLAPASNIQNHDYPLAGTVPSRQESAHAHCILMDRNNRFALACDLGLDKVIVYKLDTEENQLVVNEVAYLDVNPGAGPRHLIFHPHSDYVYVANELDSTVSVLAFDSEAGSLSMLQTISTLPDGFTGGDNWCSDIHVSADGRFLYVANRGHDSLVIYSIDDANGELTFIAHQATKGNTPRNFAIDPTGQFLLVANQDSDNIVIFRINQQTGLLDEVAVSACPTPVCLKMISL